jgi:hypothetical protein
MSRFLITQADIKDFLGDLRSGNSGGGRLYLVGETSQVLEGWRTWTDAIDFFAEVDDRAAFGRAATLSAERRNLALREENPGDIIPLPERHEERARCVDGSSHLQVFHFDPYGASFRYLARGDERDYHLVLAYIAHGWIHVDEMSRLLHDLMPKFSMDTIQQDPAEFRRRYKGLMQMERFQGPGSTFIPLRSINRPPGSCQGAL